MYRPLNRESTMWVAVIATVVVTAFAAYETYLIHTSTDGVPVPAHYRD